MLNSVTRMGELELIQQIRARVRTRRNSSLALGIGDDCAVLRPLRGHELLVTTDFSLEGKHFRRNWHPPRSVGHRALARGLSDLAAMGARPLAAFLSLALPREMAAKRAGRRWVEGFLSGLLNLADAHQVPLAGGDTSESPSGLVLADIVLVGSAPSGRSLRRSGGRPEDLIYVTGSLGGAAAELAALAQSARWPRAQGHPHLYPQPRVRVGMELVRRRLGAAAIDLSDGLSTDLHHLCAESGVGAEVCESSLPVSPEATLAQAIHGGEDYELLFAARPTVRMPRSIAGVPITAIGRLTRKRQVELVDENGKHRLLPPQGWEHFRSSL